ncbi:hypothetical protein RKD47_003479 [Streptomyces albogriseolus]
MTTNDEHQAHHLTALAGKNPAHQGPGKTHGRK